MMALNTSGCVDSTGHHMLLLPWLRSRNPKEQPFNNGKCSCPDASRDSWLVPSSVLNSPIYRSNGYHSDLKPGISKWGKSFIMPISAITLPCDQLLLLSSFARCNDRRLGRDLRVSTSPCSKIRASLQESMRVCRVVVSAIPHGSSLKQFPLKSR